MTPEDWAAVGVSVLGMLVALLLILGVMGRV